MLDSYPEATQLDAIFQRLCQGDCLAASDLIVAVLDPLLHHLKLRRRNADEHLCLTAAEDAVLSLIRKPALYDPAKCGNLFAFLRMAAERDLLNAWESEFRHHRRREHSDCVELAAEDRNAFSDEVAADLPSFDDPAIVAEIGSFTESERQVLNLMRAGERQTNAFVPILGLENLPTDEQARAVKRVKDRIKVRLQRAGRK
jgi:hypothetical protein